MTRPSAPFISHRTASFFNATFDKTAQLNEKADKSDPRSLTVKLTSPLGQVPKKPKQPKIHVITLAEEKAEAKKQKAEQLLSASAKRQATIEKKKKLAAEEQAAVSKKIADMESGNACLLTLNKTQAKQLDALTKQVDTLTADNNRIRGARDNALRNQV